MVDIMNNEDLKPIPKQNYYDEQLLKLEDFQREQNFHLAHRQLQNQLLLNPGILTGLAIQKGVAQGQVQITPGVAIDNLGRLIILSDIAKFNNTELSVQVQSGQFSLDLSDQKYGGENWLLTLEYNQSEYNKDENAPHSSQLKQIPKFEIIRSTNEASSTQIALATLSVTISQVGGTPSIDIEIYPSIRVDAVLLPNRIPKLNIDQLPEIPVTKISGQFGADLIPALSAEKITSGLLHPDRIPDLPVSKLTGKLSPDQIPDMQTNDGVSRGFYLDKPNFETGDTVTLTWWSKLDEKMTLECVSVSDIHRQVYDGTGKREKLELKPSQTATYTITFSSGDTIHEQRQFILQKLAVETDLQYMERIFQEGNELSDILVDSFFKKYKKPLTTDLAKRAGYTEQQIIKFIEEYQKSAVPPKITVFDRLEVGEIGKNKFKLEWTPFKFADFYEVDLQAYLVTYGRNKSEKQVYEFYRCPRTNDSTTTTLDLSDDKDKNIAISEPYHRGIVPDGSVEFRAIVRVYVNVPNAPKNESKVVESKKKVMNGQKLFWR